MGIARSELSERRTLDFYANPADRQEVLAALQRDGK